MENQTDWLTRFVDLITISGTLEIRCVLGAPWAVEYAQTSAREILYHVVIAGTAILENTESKATYELQAGDVVLLPHGSAHILHDGSGVSPSPPTNRTIGSVLVSENRGGGETLDMLCGRFVVAPPHDRLVRDYLPLDLVVRTRKFGTSMSTLAATERLRRLVELMRAEAIDADIGSGAILNALSTALFVLTLRAASDAGQAQTGLLALASNARLVPALTAMLNEPARAWTIPDLAELCSMSRATFMRHFQADLGRSAMELLTDIRMSAAAHALRRTTTSIESVSSLVGYQSVSAFRRVFTQWMGMTPGEWRQQVLATANQYSSLDEPDTWDPVTGVPVTLSDPN